MKLALLNCYFGTLPNYFELWLQSCATNSDVQFFLITDAKVPEQIPNNVQIIHMTFANLVKKIQSKFEFKVSIQSPYKLTDFKPAYGYIFKALFEQYDYWEYCDIDLIFGNIMKFIAAPMEQGYEKIYRLGHLTIYKNTERMRKLFSQKGGVFYYREVFSKPEFYSFDEHAGQMLIAKKQGVSEYYQEDMADISCRLKRMTASRHDNYPYQVFYYENGAVYRAYTSNGAIIIEEFSYIHIQKRKYVYEGKETCFYILSDRFLPKHNREHTEEEIQSLSEYVSKKTDHKQLAAYRANKLYEFIKSTAKEKSIWIRIKISEKKTRTD